MTCRLLGSLNPWHSCYGISQGYSVASIHCSVAAIQDSRNRAGGDSQRPRHLLAVVLAARHTAGPMQARRKPIHRTKLKSDQPREERSSHPIQLHARNKRRNSVERRLRLHVLTDADSALALITRAPLQTTCAVRISIISLCSMMLPSMNQASAIASQIRWLRF